MTIENQERRIVYDTDGTSLDYPAPFPFLEPEWLEVSVGTGEIGTADTPLVYGVDYDVTGAGGAGGGMVILHQPLPVGQKLVISRWVPLTQEEVYPEGGKFPAQTTEDCFDKLTMIAQQLQDIAERSDFLPGTSTGNATDVTTWMTAQVTAAENSAAAAKVSEDNAAASASASAGSEARAESAIVDAENAVNIAEAAAATAATAAEIAVAVADGVAEAANLARAWAQNPEDEPVRENPDTGAEEYSAYHWARKAQEVVHVEPTSETVSGIVRLGTAAEHAAGLNGVAAQPGRIRTMLFAGSGAGPKLREDILPVATNATLGGVKPDGSTITIDAAGIISASGGGGGGVPSGVICLWSGAVNAVPDTWALCNGQNGTPDLRDRFIVGAGAGYAPGATGGAWAHTHTAAANPATISGTVGATTLTTNQIPSHGHSYRTPAGSGTVRCLTTVTGHTSSGTDATTIGYTGGGASHTHSLSSTSHSHDVTVNNADSLPPFYALAYIMKL